MSHVQKNSCVQNVWFWNTFVFIFLRSHKTCMQVTYIITIITCIHKFFSHVNFMWLFWSCLCCYVQKWYSNLDFRKTQYWILKSWNFSSSTWSTKKLINEAIMNNDFLKKLEPQHTREMVDCMYEKIFAAEQLVIQEGEPGNFLYVLAGLNVFDICFMFSHNCSGHSSFTDQNAINDLYHTCKHWYLLKGMQI